MPDRLTGTVSRVIDGDTFELAVTDASHATRSDYKDTERVRMVSFSPPDPDSEFSIAGSLPGRPVTCTIHSRDPYGRLIADVEVGR